MSLRLLKELEEQTLFRKLFGMLKCVFYFFRGLPLLDKSKYLA